MILKPTNTRYVINEHFPELTTGKMGVALSGGLESTLIARICLDKYGKDNVVLVYSDDMFTKSRPESNINVKVNLDNASQLLDHEVHYIPMDLKLQSDDKLEWSRQSFEYIKQNFDVEYVMWGFTKLFFDVAEFKENKNITHEQIIEKCYSDNEKYKAVIEEFHLPTRTFSDYIKDLAIPGDVYSMLRSEFARNTTLRPFDTLNKSEVVDLYRQLGYLDLAYKTHSCVTDTIRENHTHCGVCFNCQQRYDAFAKLGIEDKTVYQSISVMFAWDQLQNAIKSDQKA